MITFELCIFHVQEELQESGHKSDKTLAPFESLWAMASSFFTKQIKLLSDKSRLNDKLPSNLIFHEHFIYVEMKF